MNEIQSSQIQSKESDDSKNQVNPYITSQPLGFTGRLTIVESVYHQPSPTEEAQGVHSSGTLITNSDEQIYSRLKVPVGEQWESIDTGWIETPIYIVIQNTTASIRNISGNP